MALYRCGGTTEKPKLLWTNPDPDSAFNAQTLSIDFSGYEALMIETYGLQGNAMVVNHTQYSYIDFTYPNSSLGGYYELSGSKNGVSRVVTLTSNSIAFELGQVGGSAMSRACIPTKIYGLKKAIM